ncbi:MAG: hypothetical protein KBH99_09885 [Syntrophobacteraceae bacterium]|nr:hypothetical protein [Syntrophobacteraceae bacterium]
MNKVDAEEWTPGRILDVSGSYWKTCALHCGVKLGVFSVLGQERMTGPEVAHRLETDERATAMLLDALAAMKLLVKSGDSYANTPSAWSLLSKDSPDYLGYILLHHHHLMDSWFQLDAAVKTGRSVRRRSSTSEEQWREDFLMGMFNMAMSIAPRIADEVDLSTRRHLLDLGGGPGTYAIHFCRKYPALRATVYDLPTTRPFAEKTIARFGVADRVDFQEGDYLEGEIAGRYDVAWLSQILHGEGPGGCRSIIRKAVSALDPGGWILVHEFILDNTKDGPLFPALFSLNMLLQTADGQAYSEEEIRVMLSEAGVTQIRRLPFQGPNQSGILAGVVP